MARAKRKNRGARRPRPMAKQRAMSLGVNYVFKAMPFILIIAAAAALFKLGMMLFLDSEYFRIKEIRVISEASVEAKSAVAAALGAKRGINIFRAGLQGCETEVSRKYPELKDVRVMRVLPDTLEISYVMRRPFCQVDSGRFYLISDDMVVLPNPLVAADPELPAITGIDISERRLLPDRRSHSKALKKAVDILKDIRNSDFSRRHKVIRINMYEPRSPSLYIEDGTRIEIGEYAFSDKADILEKVLDDLESKNRKAKIIDLRFNDAIVIPR